MQINITELKPSEYLKMLGIELPTSIAEFWDRAGYVEDDGMIDFPDAHFADMIVEGYVFAGDGKPFLDYEMLDAVWYYLFDRDSRYSLTHIQSDVEPLEGNKYVYHPYYIVYDKKLQRDVFKVVASFIVNPTRCDSDGVPHYAQAILDYISVKPIKAR